MGAQRWGGMEARRVEGIFSCELKFPAWNLNLFPSDSRVVMEDCRQGGEQRHLGGDEREQVAVMERSVETAIE